ncbi:MAG: hypothetical protein JST49_01020 [Bacteroidetes bacterium]|nr:hypothetical protein [Bacteroidota bacterium]
MRYTLITAIAMLALAACKKEATNANQIAGTYNGNFHTVGSCYGCVPYTDTTYSGSFEVSINSTGDSVTIFNPESADMITYALNDSNEYYAGTTSYISAKFIAPDSLYYRRHFAGSGGYSTTTFEGRR